jgi:hypothetical protein
METTRRTYLDSRIGDLVVSEWDARPLRPVAHWVLMPATGGRQRLEMVWQVPDPIPPADLSTDLPTHRQP